MLNKLERFHNSRPGQVVFAVLTVGLAYVFVSLAIDSGSWWDYAIALLSLIACLQNIIAFVSGKPWSKK